MRPYNSDIKKTAMNAVMPGELYYIYSGNVRGFAFFFAKHPTRVDLGGDPLSFSSTHVPF